MSDEEHSLLDEKQRKGKCSEQVTAPSTYCRFTRMPCRVYGRRTILVRMGGHRLRRHRSITMQDVVAGEERVRMYSDRADSRDSVDGMA